MTEIFSILYDHKELQRRLFFYVDDVLLALFDDECQKSVDIDFFGSTIILRIVFQRRNTEIYKEGKLKTTTGEVSTP